MYTDQNGGKNIPITPTNKVESMEKTTNSFLIVNNLDYKSSKIIRSYELSIENRKNCF